MDLFPLVNVMFTNPKRYGELKNSDKSKNHFMIQRFMAIQWPSESQKMNRNGINGIGVIDTWQFVTSRFKRVPGWIYTKTKKTKSQEKLEVKEAEDLGEIYLKVNEISRRDFEQLTKLNPEAMEKYFTKMKLQYETYVRD